MRKLNIILAASAASLLLASCGTLLGSGNRRPDEFAVARNAPLVVPPDFALTPPAPGAASPSATDSRAQAVEALFGGPSPRSISERVLIRESQGDRAASGARSVAGDPNTSVVDKGVTTQTILAVPEGDGQEATVSTPK